MARRELMPGQKRLTPGGVGAEVLTVLWFVFSLFPIVWLILLSLKSTEQQQNTFFTFTPTLDNFRFVLFGQTGSDLRQGLFNSLITSAGAVLVSLIIGIPAAYAAGRWKYKGSDDLMFQMLSFRFAPELMVLVPLFIIYRQTGLLDSSLGLIWVLQLVTMPLVVWILRSYFQDLPPDLEQAALLDGYTRTQAFVRIALPLVRPGIAAGALLAFIFAWNSYVFPLILANNELKTVTVAIATFQGGGGQIYYNHAAAAALIGALPPLILALSIQRYLVRGLSFGAVKA
ncbi:carbohydrate ABC transporter permease [Nakamurella flavida]|uniref:Carbohydrate ABC transporter permease n=1 Tax=Nakamurella flavida TaxID=363630 RepID=A0A938YFK4_9ACTN|nr:carbohydrate ABC transporter permease [Nakamurella flavida]MBM9476765.1 carbohydrate ABC transporter permease [Nakamurella flavida]MDP9778797.1 multiple sugar transport system permease protein [Nakamurella flavida]